MLTPEQKAFYDANGYIHISGLLTPEEAAHLRTETHDLMERFARIKSIDATWGSARALEGAQDTKVLHCHDVQFQSAAFARLIVHEKLTAVAASIIGPNVQLHHTKAFVKPPEKGSPFPMHQDAPFFPHDHHSMIAAIIHFDDAPLEKGCVRVVPGSHKNGILPHLSDGGWHLDPQEWRVEDATPIPAKAGDALFFSYLTVHGSGVNTSSEARTTVLIQMRDPVDPPTIRTHESRGQGMMLRGFDPSAGTTKPSSEANAPAISMGGSMGNAAMIGGKVEVTMGGR